MSGISPIGPGNGGGFDPNRRKSPEERRAEAECMKKKREKIAQENIEKIGGDVARALKGFHVDADGTEHFDDVC